MPDLLLELFSEEIPARMQGRAADDLKRLVTDAMVEAGLTYSGGRAFSTPRRLALALSGLPKVTPETVEERRGPRTDAPEKALEGFLRATGLSRGELEVRDDKKGQVYFAATRRPGRPAAAVVAEAVTGAVRNFPWPKSMRWGEGSLRWVRPLHSILCILSDEAGAEVVPLEVDGVPSGDVTRGHRFMGSLDAFRVTGFEDYAHRLEAAKVVLDPEERARRIKADAATLAFARGLEVVPDPGLLAEVSGLVEWPVALMGKIDDAFLDLPPEVLQTSMREHQKFFSVRDNTGRIGHFVTVANIEAPDGGKAILEGNGRVLSARLADARYFWENDLRKVREVGMEGLAKPLEGVTFHAKLGTQAERVRRIEALAREIAPKVGAKPDLAAEAARIAKADLASEMVYEFPELQGTMGRYYAEAAGHDSGVPEACEEHYRPLGPSDAVPTGPVSVAVALADKLDMLTGFWAIDEKPTGSKDPFALRRAALGVIRLVLENAARVALSHSIEKAGITLTEQIQSRALADAEREYAKETKRLARDYGIPEEDALNYREGFEDDIVAKEASAQAITDRFMPKSRNVVADTPISERTDLLTFFADRLKVYLRDQGIRHDVIQACFELGGQDDLVLLVNRVRALQDFLGTNDGENLLIAYRRAANIVSAEEKKDGVEYSMPPENKFAELPEERDLFAALDLAEPAIAAALKLEDFAAAMTEMARLRAPIDAFFDKVTVNAENPVVRRNRLCLLTRVRQVMRQVAIWDAIEG
jgi:glycyl-tRNA synthetase beta chain